MASHVMPGEFTLTAGLARDERLLRSGRPRQGLASGSRALVVCAGAVLLVGGLFWLWQGRIVGRIDAGDPNGRLVLTVRMIQALTLLVPVLILAAPLVLDFMVRRRTVYGLTNRRVVIVGGLDGRRVTSLPLVALSEISLDVDDGGSGTIGFGPERKQAAQAFGFTWIGPNSSHRLDGIDDARRVYAQILDAQRALIALAACGNRTFGCPAVPSGSIRVQSCSEDPFGHRH